MKELAELAGVDISTVSRALRGDTKRVAASTIARVQTLAREIGYVPDPVASSLRSGRSGIIGVLVPSLSDIVMGILVSAIDDAARDLGLLSTVVATHDDRRTRERAIERFLSRRVDGLILCDSEVGEALPEPLLAKKVPFVFAMRSSSDGVSVTADDTLGGRLVAGHFLDAGHRVIGVVPGPPRARTALDRVGGFSSVVTASGRTELVTPPAGLGGFGVDDGFAATRALLARDHRPTAVFCPNDHSAIGAGRAIRDAGLRVGSDVALVGYNDIPQAAYLETPLSSVRTDVGAMGRGAAEQLVASVRGHEAASVTLTPTLVVRASSS